MKTRDSLLSTVAYSIVLLPAVAIAALWLGAAGILGHGRAG